jgi:cell division protein FtsB
MATRTKLTPFARFFIFLIIFLPLAYFGAAYYRGEDPIAAIKGMVSGDATTDQATSKRTYDPQEEINRLLKENQALRQQVKELETTLEALENKDTNRQKWGN